LEKVKSEVAEVTAQAQTDAKAAMSNISMTSKDSYTAAKNEVLKIQSAATEKIMAIYDSASEELKKAGVDVAALKESATAKLKSLF